MDTIYFFGGGNFFGNPKKNFWVFGVQKMQKNALFCHKFPARPPPPVEKTATGTRSWGGPGLEQPQGGARSRPVTLIIRVLFGGTPQTVKIGHFDTFYQIKAYILHIYRDLPMKKVSFFRVFATPPQKVCKMCHFCAFGVCTKCRKIDIF